MLQLIQAPALYKNFGPAVVELAWLAKFKLNVWAAAPFNCSSQVRNRTVVVDLLLLPARLILCAVTTTAHLRAS